MRPGTSSLTSDSVSLLFQRYRLERRTSCGSCPYHEGQNVPNLSGGIGCNRLWVWRTGRSSSSCYESTLASPPATSLCHAPQKIFHLWPEALHALMTFAAAPMIVVLALLTLGGGTHRLGVTPVTANAAGVVVKCRRFVCTHNHKRRMTWQRC